MFHHATQKNDDEYVIGIFYNSQLVGEVTAFISENAPGQIQVDVRDGMDRRVTGWTDYIEEEE